MAIDRNNYLGAPKGTEYDRSLIGNLNRAPQYEWAGAIKESFNFVSPNNTMICVADAPIAEAVTKFTILGMCQSMQVNESQAMAYIPEIGSRRKRPAVGGSQGGSIQLSGMVCTSHNLLGALLKYNPTFSINNKAWQEDTTHMDYITGLNHDKLKTVALGIIVIEQLPDEMLYRAIMHENALIQGDASGYQSGQNVVVQNLSLAFEQRLIIATGGAK